MARPTVVDAANLATPIEKAKTELGKKLHKLYKQQNEDEQIREQHDERRSRFKRLYDMKD